MKIRIVLLLVAFAALTLPLRAIDWLKTAQLYAKSLDEQIAAAKERVDAPAAWQQCELTLQSLEETVAKLPDADRAPFLAKIKEVKPAVAAGAARNRAGNIARRITDTLASAREDLAAGRSPASYYEKLDEYFAEADLKALPPERLKKLQADYADLKKSAAK
jgi:hypothetical protein